MPSVRLPPHRQTPALVSSPFHPTSLPPSAGTQSLAPHALFDLVIIGAGPACLALLTRLLESRPAALYTEEEHRYLHWLDQKAGKTSASVKQPRAGRKHVLRVIKTKASGRGAERVIAGEKSLHDQAEPDEIDVQCGCGNELKILVVDKIGDGFMANWNRLFKALDIQHLRSPLFWHPCPADLDSLLAYAQRGGRINVADGSFITDSAMRACNHEKKAVGRRSRGRDRRIKRLGCCAELDDLDGAESDLAPAKPDLIEIPGVIGTDKSKHKKCRQRLDPHKYGRLVGATGGAINERDRKDYFTPSTKLFQDFLRDDLMKRYGISDQGNWPTAKEVLCEAPSVSKCGGSTGDEDHRDAAAHLSLPQEHRDPATTVKGDVCSMTWSDLRVDDSDTFQGFFLETTDGAKFGAKAVVSAVGPAGKPSIPTPLATKKPDPGDGAKCGDCPGPPPLHGPGWCHTAALAHAGVVFPPPAVQAKSSLQEKILVVVGGGLTSAQISDVALRRGFTKVKLLMRGHMKVKPFDVSLDWMGRYSNLRKMQFWQEDDPAVRLAMFRDARQGGSLTLPYARLMKKYEEMGKLEILTHTEIEDGAWDPKNNQWSLTLRSSAPPNPRVQAKKAYEEARKVDETGDLSGDQDETKLEAEKENMPPVDKPATTGSSDSEQPKKGSAMTLQADYIVCASAFMPNFAEVPFMRKLATQYPVRHEGGFPVVSEDLQFGDLPLFVVGLYSALQIGPAAGNLGGIREAADRVVTRLQTLIGSANPLEVFNGYWPLT
ncbi:unnamed protein product [Parajaminaea phylloscopi]